MKVLMSFLKCNKYSVPAGIFSEVLPSILVLFTCGTHLSSLIWFLLSCNSFFQLCFNLRKGKGFKRCAYLSALLCSPPCSIGLGTSNQGNASSLYSTCSRCIIFDELYCRISHRITPDLLF